jgi:D-alanyl-D-alanine endopeptidase (penicillin-binding protein 7)
MPQKRKLTVRHAVYFLTACLATWFVLFPIPTQAAAPDTKIQTFAASDIADGNSLNLTNGAKLVLFPGALPNPTDISLGVITENLPTLPTGSKLDGFVYQLNVIGSDHWSTGLALINTLVLPATTDTYYRQIWQYDLTVKKWVALTSKNYPSKNIVTAFAKSTNAYYAVLIDRRTQEGVASWYCKNHCSTRYPTLHGTSNNFAVGTYVNVTNPENNKSVKVKIISRWGEPAGRVVDLSWAAFAKIKGANSGLARVKVTSKIPVSTKKTIVIDNSVDVTPALHVRAKSNASAPLVTATSYTVYDEGSATILASVNSNTTRPIASITKLLTAAVFLDTKPNLSKLITYRAGDATPYGYLRIKVGDVISYGDALNALLVGSANNAAPILVRASGLSYQEFLKRINAKAKQYGATKTSIVDMHGLSYNDKSTSTDLVKIAANIFSQYPEIKKITSLRSYDFTTRNTKIKHHLASTDKLLLNGPMPTGLKFAGAKTGFINEAKYTYVIRFKDASGAKIVVATLGSSTAASRYQDAVKLANWARNSFEWYI